MASSTINVPRHVADKVAALQKRLGRTGWGRLDPAQRSFFADGLTRASVVEAAMWALAKQMCEGEHDGLAR